MKDLEKELENAFEPNIPEPNLDDLKMFDSLLEENKKKKAKHNKKSYIIFRRCAISCVLVLSVLITALLPVIILSNKDDNTTKYYGDNEVIKVETDASFVQDYFTNNLPNYTFILEDCEWHSGFAIYDKETEKKLLALSFKVENVVTPVPEIPTFTIKSEIEIDIILDKHYTFADHSKFVSDSTIEAVNNINIYSVTRQDVKPKYYTLFERPKYNTYVLMTNIKDDDFLEKFKQN